MTEQLCPESARLMFGDYLSAYCDRQYRDGRVAEACRYALRAPGKLVRPILTILSSQACRGTGESALPFALAVELIHTYSLVHDDLPAMDDDDLRRGQPTVHKKFDEATAVLVGDALLADAFGVLAKSAIAPGESCRILAEVAGSRGLVRGQDLDLIWTGRDGYTLQDLATIHHHKSAQLISACFVFGGIAAGYAPGSDVLDLLESIGNEVGQVFQMVDDLIDDQPGTGKGQGKDIAQNKLTYRKFFESDELRRRAVQKTEDALTQISRLPGATLPLEQFIRQLALRHI